ncbi:MAG: DUF3152 domain-containing protein [Segniliparus sp.]|uniref:DUF3152 domain-containing protein n=1 Tax=Segniliparus sp. TaxID=2804064 RepID=UPI003F332394
MLERMTWTGSPEYRPSPVSGWGAEPIPYQPPAPPQRRPLVKAPLRARVDPAGLESRADRGAPKARAPRRKQGWFGRVMRLYGWRVYMIPVLAVITTLIAVDGFRPHNTSAAETASASRTRDGHSLGGKGIGIPIGNTLSDRTKKTGALPEGVAFTQGARGTWAVVAGPNDRYGPGDAKKFFRYTVEVEDGVDLGPLMGVDGFSSGVDSTLRDPHSWIGGTDQIPGSEGDTYAFQRVSTPEEIRAAESAADADDKNHSGVGPTGFFRISLTSPETTRQECGYDIQLETSCYKPQDRRVVLNFARWVRGAIAFNGDRIEYRKYMVNHEVGHAIGHPNHQPCYTDGSLAPIMMQQSFGVANNDIADLDPAGVVPPDGKVCKPNAWPYP